MSIEEINLDAVKDGMLLGGDITGTGGTILMRAGMVLSCRHVALLRAHGINTIPVRREQTDSDSRETLDEDAIETLVKERFMHTDHDHPLVKELIRLYRLRLQPDAENRA